MVNGYREQNNDRSLQEKLNAYWGKFYWEPTDYEHEPDYEDVDAEMFQFLKDGIEAELEPEER